MTIRAMIWGGALGLAFAGAFGSDARAQTEDPTAACHRLAASPDDPGRVGARVAWRALDADAAIAACQAAASAHPRDARLLFQLGRAFDKANRAEEAMAAHQASAEAGFALAWVGMGDIFAYGDGVAVNGAKAAEFYSRAREANNPVGAGALAYLHESGNGFPKDEEKAVPLYREAAAAGYAYAQRQLGYHLEHGLGVPQDEKEALRWYRLAAGQGLADAQNDMGIMFNKGIGGLAKDRAEAAKWFRLAIDQTDEEGSYDAALDLGRLHAYGLGIARDKAEAERLFRYGLTSSEESVVHTAQNELAYLLAVEGIKLDEAEALARSALAAAEGSSQGAANSHDTLAWVLYRQGRHEEALAFALKATGAEGDNPINFDHLGDIYLALGKKEEARRAWQKALALPLPEDDSAADFDPEAVQRKLAA